MAQQVCQYYYSHFTHVCVSTPVISALVLLKITNIIITVDAGDYEVISTTLGPYNDGTRGQCFDVTILDDPDPEREQVFFIDFEPTNNAVFITPGRVAVTILDNDCKLAHHIIAN